MKSLLLALLLAAPLQAEYYRSPERRQTIQREAATLRGTHDDAYPHKAPARLTSDAKTLSTAITPLPNGITPAGASMSRVLLLDRPLLASEANLLGDIGVRYVLNAPDRVNIPVLTRDGTMLMIRSDSVGRAVFAHPKEGYVGMMPTRLIPKEGTLAFNGTMDLIWSRRINRPPPTPTPFQRIVNYFHHKPKPNPFGEYTINNPSTFTRATTEEARLGELARQISPVKAHELRKQGFVPIDELAGGTPWHPSDVDGWVMPFRDGVKTFPESD